MRGERTGTEIYKRDSLSHYLNTKVLICRLSLPEAGQEQLPKNYKITILRDHAGLGNIYIPDSLRRETLLTTGALVETLDRSRLSRRG